MGLHYASRSESARSFVRRRLPSSAARCHPQQRGFNARDVEEEFVFADTQAWYFARKGLGLEPFGRNAQTRGTIEKASQITDSMVGSFTPVQLSL
jgi:hypothetical protein